MKKLLSLLLAVLLAVSLLPMSVFAEGPGGGNEVCTHNFFDQEGEPVVECTLCGITNPDQCGEAAYYIYDEATKELVIYGTGKIADNAFDSVFGDAKAKTITTAVETITIKSGITDIGNRAFFHCIKCSEVVLPDGLVTIGKSAFFGDTFNYIDIPATVKTIEPQAFSCSGLIDITLPKTVESVGNNCFADCKNLNTVTLYCNTKVGDFLFGDNDSDSENEDGNSTFSTPITVKCVRESSQDEELRSVYQEHIANGKLIMDTASITHELSSDNETCSLCGAEVNYVVTIEDSSLFTTTGAGTYRPGETVTITAVPNHSGIIFDCWNKWEDGGFRYFINKSTYTFKITSDMRFSVDDYAVHTASISTGGGNGIEAFKVTSDYANTNQYGYICYTADKDTLQFRFPPADRFTAPEGKLFDYWDWEFNDQCYAPGDVVTLIGDDAVPGYDIGNTMYITARWKDAYVLKIDDNPEFTITGAGTYAPSDEVTVTAVPKHRGVVFEDWRVWTEGLGNLFSKDSSYTFNINNDKHLSVESHPAQVAKISPAGGTGETVDVYSNYANTDHYGFVFYTADDDTLQFHFPSADYYEAPEGKEFDHWGWSLNGESYAPGDVVTIIGDGAVRRFDDVNYLEDTEKIDVYPVWKDVRVLTIDNNPKFTITGAGTYEFGDEVTVTAVPKHPGVVFADWDEHIEGGGSRTVSARSTYSFIIRKDTRLSVSYDPYQEAVVKSREGVGPQIVASSINANENDQGYMFYTSDNDGDLKFHFPAADFFKAPEGKLFAGWVMDGITYAPGDVLAVIENGEETDFSSDLIITAKWKESNVWVSGEQFSADKLTISCGDGTATYDPATATVTLDGATITQTHEGSGFGGAIYAEQDITVNVIGDSTISLGEYTNGEGIYTSGNLTITGNKALDITIKREDGYSDAIWVNGGNLTVDMEGNLTVNSTGTGLSATGNITLSGDGSKTIRADADANGIYSSGADITLSGSGDVTIDAGYGIYAQTGKAELSGSGSVTINSAINGTYSVGDMILSGSGEVDIYGEEDGVELGGADSAVLLKGTGSPITLKAGAGNKAVLNAGTGESPVTGTNFDDYKCVIGAPDTVSVVYGPEHSFTNYVSDGNATCIADGTKSAVCDNGCGTTDTQPDVGTAKGHTYGNPTYQWNDDKCTATRTCTVCAEGTTGHADTETVTGIYVKDTDATCTAAESGHYEAEFANTAFTAQQTTADSVINGNSLGHDFTGEYKDNDDGTHSCKCTRCDEYGATENHSYKDYVCVCGAEDLTGAKEETIDEIDAAKTDANTDIAEAAIEAINDATSVDEVSTLKEQALADMAVADAAAELTAAKEEAKAAIDNAVPADASDAVKVAAENAKTAIDDAKSVEDVNAAKESGIAAIEDQIAADSAAAELAEAKETAIDEINKAKTDANASVAEEAIKAINNATTVDEVSALKEQTLADMAAADVAAELAAAKEEAKEAILAEQGDDTSEAVAKAAEETIAAIEAATTVEEVNAAMEDGIAAIRAAKAGNAPPTPVTYTVIDGANSVWTKGSTSGLVVRSDAPFAKFVCVKVDGKTIAATNYTAKEGSTIVTLNSAYLETLETGKHAIEIVSADGSASTNFTVKANSQPADSSDPQTGDSSMIYLWTLILVVSAAGLSATAIYSRKRKHN